MVEVETRMSSAANSVVTPWRWWGEPDGKPLLRIQGTPSCRVQRNPDESALRENGARYLMADRPGFGGSTRTRGRGIADVADAYAELIKAHGLDRVPAMGTRRASGWTGRPSGAERPILDVQ